MKTVVAVAHVVITTALCACVSSVHAQQSWPTKAVRIIIPHPPGGPLDISPRAAAQELSKKFNQAFVIENHDGADGILGAQAALKSTPDGYNWMVTSNSVMVINPLVRTSLPYNPERDFLPVVEFGSLLSTFIVHPSVPVKSMQELMELAKQKPDELTFGTLGSTSMGPLFIGWARAEKGVRFYQIPYKSTNQALQATVAGQVNVSTYAAGNVAPLQRAGKVRALAVVGDSRTDLLPEVPTLKEAGIDFEFQGWVAMFAPAGTPREFILRMNAEIASLLADPQFHAAYVKKAGLDRDSASGKSPEEFGRFLAKNRETMARLIKIAGVKPQ